MPRVRPAPVVIRSATRIDFSQAGSTHRADDAGPLRDAVGNATNPGSRAKRVADGHPGRSAGENLLVWYDRHRRALPWRENADPYRVWLSEVMLQQTTVAAVIPYYAKFLARWPTVACLAAAEDGEVMAAWAGLGYYARARNLVACARAVASMGAFPATLEGLRALPGLGDYTAAAVAAIAFGVSAAVVDGNVERVVARLIRLPVPPKAARPQVVAAVAAMMPGDRPGDYAQAMMDLGATICTPRRPACALCPLRPDCAAAASGDPLDFPVRVAKKKRADWRGVAFVPVRPNGTVLLRRRPPRGLLGGMLEAFGSPWGPEPADPFRHAPFAAAWRDAGTVTHGFTHAVLTLDVFVAEVGADAAEAGGVSADAPEEGRSGADAAEAGKVGADAAEAGGVSADAHGHGRSGADARGEGWYQPADAGLPTLMRKVVERAVASLDINHDGVCRTARLP